MKTNINAVLGSLITPVMLNKAVSKVWGISENELFIHTRRPEIVEPRQVVQYYRYKVLKHSPTVIANETGVKQSTIHASVRVISKQLEVDKALNRKLKEITQILK